MNQPRKVTDARRRRPLPRPQRWALDVAAPGELHTWHDPAARLVAVLRGLAELLPREYQQPITWWTAGDGEAPWADADAVTKIMERQRTHDTEDDQPAPGARGVVQGWLGEDRDAPLVDVLWSAGVSDRLFSCTVRFNPRGGARSLSRHQPEWLISLLRTAVESAGATVGRIVTSSWLKEDERRMGWGVPLDRMIPFWLGEVTYLSRAIDPDTLPDSLIAHPGRHGTVVALADLSATVTGRTDVIDEALTLRPYLATP
ncbi:MAG: hypothetical protein ACRDT4_21665 [Micromonosporaceae bacterium]